MSTHTAENAKIHWCILYSELQCYILRSRDIFIYYVFCLFLCMWSKTNSKLAEQPAVRSNFADRSIPSKMLGNVDYTGIYYLKYRL